MCVRRLHFLPGVLVAFVGWCCPEVVRGEGGKKEEYSGPLLLQRRPDTPKRRPPSPGGLPSIPSRRMLTLAADCRSAFLRSSSSRRLVKRGVGGWNMG